MSDSTKHTPLNERDNKPRTLFATYIDRWSQSALPVTAMSVMCGVAIPFSGMARLALPSHMQLLGFTSIFGMAAYANHKKDIDNAAGIATAWSLVYLFVNGRAALRTLRPAPLLLLAAATGNATIYGKRAINSWL
ncbi:hypothetical protein BDF22DRAFT_772893 [Syncephalis plumigaleata]|nr:hypothetical protein BDF22DRAFT_772893 [Syncephalis plumigaleata]